MLTIPFEQVLGVGELQHAVWLASVGGDIAGIGDLPSLSVGGARMYKRSQRTYLN